MRNTIGKVFSKSESREGTLTPFQAVCTALAGTVGTGNIAGAADAVAIGGPGAVFWMCCFAFSTIIGWGLYGSRCVEFLFGNVSVRPFLVVYSFISIVGATMELGLLWDIADTCNGLMAILNLIALFLLSGVVVKLTREHYGE